MTKDKGRHSISDIEPKTSSTAVTLLQLNKGKIREAEKKLSAAEVVKELCKLSFDRESMTLTMKLLCEPSELIKEQREELKNFMEAIINELNEFKEENHLEDGDLQIIQDDLFSLCIIISTLTLYDELNQRLANNLEPRPKPKAQEKSDVTKDKPFALNPFSMEPKPSPSNVNEEDEMEEQKIFNPSPFKQYPW